MRGTTNPRIGPSLAVCWLLLVLPCAAQEPLIGIAVDRQGNVGIGLADPAKKLHVAGDSLIEGVAFGGGQGGQAGQALVVNGFDPVYGDRSFYFRFNPAGATPQEQVQIYTLDPTDPQHSVYKTFVIDHPSDAERYLVHASLEGPEGAVYYRGSARLEGGRAIIELPAYFEALTAREGRTVQLTNVDGFDRLAVESRDGRRVVDGRFTVVADDAGSSQAFDWEVKAVRADGPPLEVEPRRDAIDVRGLGPYTYARPRSGAAAAPREDGR